MSSKPLHQSIPEWLSLAEKIIGEQFIDIKNVDGGTSTEIWHVICKSSNEYAMRNRDKKRCSNDFIRNIESAFTDKVLPQGFKICDCGLFYLIYYDWIYGYTYKEYRIQYVDILMQLSKLHNNRGYGRGISSYVNIICEAEEVSMKLRDDFRLSKSQKNAIQESVSILNYLNEDELEKMLDNRSSLTHGDPKPKNIVINHNGFVLIDWDKLCSVSPEFDLVYTAFTGMMWENVFNIEKWCEKNKEVLEHDIFNLTTRFLPHMYLIHDTYRYLYTGNRFEYLIDEVFPLYYSWKDKVRGI